MCTRHPPTPNRARVSPPSSSPLPPPLALAARRANDVRLEVVLGLHDAADIRDPLVKGRDPAPEAFDVKDGVAAATGPPHVADRDLAERAGRLGDRSLAARELEALAQPATTTDEPEPRFRFRGRW